jgi:hypothetical protein
MVKTRRGLPRASDPKPRVAGQKRPRYRVFPVSESDLEFVEEMMGENPTPQGLSVYTRYCEIREQLVELEPQKTVLAIKYFAGQVGQTLGPSTLVTYLGYIKSMSRDVGLPLKGEAFLTWVSIYAAARRRAARLKSNGALALTTPIAIEVLEAVSHYDLRAAYVLYLIAAVGVRASTLSCCLRSWFAVSQDDIQFQERVGKGIKRAEHTRGIRETWKNVGLPVPYGLKRFLAEGPPGEVLFPKHPSEALCGIIRAAYKKIHVTSYCFRKMFGERMYVQFGGDMHMVSRAMGHKNPQIGSAFYLGLEFAGQTPVDFSDAEPDEESDLD